MRRPKIRDVPRFSPKWWLTLPFTAQDIYQRLSPPDSAVADMSYWWYGTLERRAAEDLFPAAKHAELKIRNPGFRDPSTSITLHELNAILMGLLQTDARRVLEIGTFDGNTTLNMAANLPEDGQVVTIDLPVEGDTDYALELKDSGLRNVTDRQRVGEQFLEDPLKARIQQVYGDSAKVDFDALGGPFDFAFIDGCHDYEYVKSDTENVLGVMRKGGIVMWHDYAFMESVSEAVDEFRWRVDELCAIQGSRLAMGVVR